MEPQYKIKCFVDAKERAMLKLLKFDDFCKTSEKANTANTGMVELAQRKALSVEIVVEKLLMLKPSKQLA